MRTRDRALGEVEREVRSEQASALGRVGRRLEGFLEELQQLERALASAQGAERRPLLAAHARTRQQAELYLWYLVVQREAIGLKNHADLEEYYPIPRAIRE